MNISEIQQIGTVVRKVRKERGLRLGDLADENISSATISNIERSVPHVHDSKVYYLLDKLKIGGNEGSEVMYEEENILRNSLLKLKLVSILWKSGKAEAAI
ncbi:helix-turn-helix domain-containing protein [Paludifilum halophilum]|uniref:HTH cro/C1-type domain-containing protein n=1 Tax=Paludifilum halophilum TaxID=1642702 RepID=A0A235B777_9BACL|nr:hypothetical protein [Paludifilum halophilum]OYD08082.1 hypothetical protein CHM34_08190 [Paludifilum halophilum]